MLLDKNNLESSIVSYTLDGFSLTAKTWTYENKATIFVLDKDAKYNQDFYYVLKGGVPDAGTSIESMNAEMFSNPFDAYARFQDLLNESTQPPPTPPEDVKLPILLKDKKTNEVEIREVNGNLEVGDEIIAQGYIVDKGRINLSSDDSFETKLYFGQEEMDVILIKIDKLDKDNKDAYFIIPKQPEPEETKTIVLKNPNTNEVKIKQTKSDLTSNYFDGYIVEPNKISLASENNFTTILFVQGMSQDVNLIRNQSLDEDGMDGYEISQQQPPPPPEEQTIFLKNPNTNEVQIRQVDSNGVVQSQNMGNAFIVQPIKINLASENRFETTIFFAGQPQPIKLVRNASMDTDGLDAYVVEGETPPPEKRSIVLKSPTTNEIQIREIDDQNVVSNQVLANGFISQNSAISLSSEDKFETKMYVNNKEEEVVLIRIQSLDTDGLDAYVFEGKKGEEKKTIILKNPSTNQVQIRELDDNGDVQPQVLANGYIFQNTIINLKSENEFDTKLFLGGAQKDVKLVRANSLDSYGLDAYMIMEKDDEKKSSVILKTPSTNQVQIREVDENNEITNNILGNGFIQVNQLISLKSEDRFETQLFINNGANDVKLVRNPSMDVDGLEAYVVEGEGEPKKEGKTILLKNPTTNQANLRVLDDENNISEPLVTDVKIQVSNVISLASEDEFETKIYIQGEEFDCILMKNPNYDKDGFDGYDIRIKAEKDETTPPEIPQEIVSDRVRIISEVSGIDQDVVKNNFRSVNLAVNFLSGINFKELQNRLGTNKTAYQLAQEINQEVRNS
jgi:hypothetical protein